MSVSVLLVVSFVFMCVSVSECCAYVHMSVVVFVFVVCLFVV